MTRALLDRYWVGHPAVVEVDCGGGPAFVGPVAAALRGRADRAFVLMLDDYALCGPVNGEAVGRATDVVRRDDSVGMCALGWYPSARRERRRADAGVDELIGAPVLLQAAVWRRQWFLELAEAVGPEAGAWGFEGLATQAAKRRRVHVCGPRMKPPAWVGGPLVDGFDKSDWAVPYHNLMHRGRAAREHEGFLRDEGFSFPAEGLGDSIASVVEAAGIGSMVRAVERMTGRPCGCAGRRRWVNERVPYR